MIAVLEAAGVVAIGYAVLSVLALVYGWTQSHHALPQLSSKVALALASSSSSSSVDVLRPFFTTSHDFALFVRKWLPHPHTTPRGIVFLVHGLSEHAGRYDHIARILARAGFAVFAVDHQGHGLSDGERLFAQKLVHLAEDYLEFVDHVVNGPSSNSVKNASVLDPTLDPHTDVDWSQLPKFLFGHSMGSVVALQIAELSHARGVQWDGVVLSASAIDCTPLSKLPWFFSLVAKLSAWMPKNTVPPISFEVLSDDRNVGTRWLRDPLRSAHGPTVRMVAEMLTEGRRFAQQESAFMSQLPLYLLHGEHDAVCFLSGGLRLFNRWAAKDKTLRVVPTPMHEALSIKGYDEVLMEIVAWMENHFAVSAS